MNAHEWINLRDKDNNSLNLQKNKIRKCVYCFKTESLLIFYQNKTHETYAISKLNATTKLYDLGFWLIKSKYDKNHYFNPSKINRILYLEMEQKIQILYEDNSEEELKDISIEEYTIVSKFFEPKLIRKPIKGFDNKK